MRFAIIIFLLSLSVCLVFLNTPGMLKDQYDPGTFFGKGRVLGAQELAEDLSINDVLDNKLSLPMSSEKQTSREPIRRLGDNFVLASGYAIAMDESSEAILFEKDSQTPVPIASITKLMTALVALEMDMKWENYYRIKSSDHINGGRVYLNTGEQVKIKDLLYLSLIGSANTATRAMVSAAGMEEANFVELMNEKAQAMGLEQMKFADPIGLSHKNSATPREVAQLTKIAARFDFIREAIGKKEYRFSTLAGKSKLVRSTNNILGYKLSHSAVAIGGKTGYTISAGYCLAGVFEREDKHRIITVVLGASESADRFRITRDLVGWVYESYEWED